MQVKVIRNIIRFTQEALKTTVIGINISWFLCVLITIRMKFKKHRMNGVSGIFSGQKNG